MFTHYLKLAIRAMGREKLRSAMVLGGLSVAVSVVLLAGLYVKDEYSFDQFHSKSDRIYRLLSSRMLPDGRQEKTPIVKGPLKTALASEFPEVETATRLLARNTMGRTSVTIGEKAFYEDNVMVVEPSFFDVFDFRMTTGDAKTILASPQAAIITESLARKYFGESNAVGQIIRTDRFEELTISGVMADPPGNSHLQFGMLVSEVTLASLNPRWSKISEDWRGPGFVTYIVASPVFDEAAFLKRLESVVAAAYPDVSRRPKLSIQALPEVHLNSMDVASDLNARASKPIYAQVFGLISLMVLGIAAINYVNLATARLTTRQKEIGLRKVTGAHRADLIRQFLTEAALISSVAVGLGLILTESLMSTFNDMVGRTYRLGDALDPMFIAGAVTVFGLLCFATGLYPSMVMSAVKPMQILRGQSGLSGRSVMRKALVVSQLTLSIITVAATVVIYRQLDFIRSRELGFQPDSRIVVDINSGRVRKSAMEMKAELQAVSGVHAVTVATRVPGEWKEIDQTDFTLAERPSEPYRLFFFGGDDQFLDVFGIQLMAGRNFSSMADTASVLVNETAVAALGMTNPLGRELVERGSGARLRIIGVVRDFHFQSLHQSIQPALIGYWKNPVTVIDYFTAHLGAHDVTPVLKAFEKIHNRYDGVTPMESNVLTNKIASFYDSEQRTVRIFTALAFVAIVIACSGIFSLIQFSVERRTKEIGIRKVLGASALGISRLIASDFAMLVFVANVMAWPIAFTVSGQWLTEFAYRTEWSWADASAIAVISLAVVLLIISVHTTRASLRNPAEILKYE